jgi:peptidoglycan hydrolase FlgJ
MDKLAFTPATAPLMANLAKPTGQPEDPKLREAAQGFESLFLATLLKGGHSEAFKDELTGSNAVDSMRDMMDAQLAKSGAAHSGLGIAQSVVRQFTPTHLAPHPGPYPAPKE